MTTSLTQRTRSKCQAWKLNAADWKWKRCPTKSFEMNWKIRIKDDLFATSLLLSFYAWKLSEQRKLPFELLSQFQFACNKKILFFFDRVEFSVGDKPIHNFRMIEKHFFKDKLLKTFDFDFGFCIPNSLNTCEHIYEFPALSTELSMFLFFRSTFNSFLLIILILILNSWRNGQKPVRNQIRQFLFRQQSTDNAQQSRLCVQWRSKLILLIKRQAISAR